MPYLLTFLFGLCIGSFLNVVIWRGPAAWGLAHSAHTDRPPLFGKRSECAKCGEQLKIWHLIPIVSWLILRARCAFCGEPISIRYPLVELIFGLLAAGFVWWGGWHPVYFVYYMAVIFLIMASGIIDFDTGYLPDALTVPLIALGLLGGWFWMLVSFSDALIGAVVGYGVFWLIRFIYLKMRGVEGLGLGDAKMLAGLGAVTGWMSLPFIILIAALSGLCAVGIMSLRGKEISSQTPIRFGPYLALAGLVVFILVFFDKAPWMPVWNTSVGLVELHRGIAGIG